MEISVLETGWFRMEYASFGTGRIPLVIIPGMSLRSVMLSADVVAHQFRELADTHTVYLFERRMDMPEGFSVSDMAADAVEAMLALGMGKADIYGASQGAMIAMEIACGHPELVRKLALASTIARQNPVSIRTMSRWKELALEGDIVGLNRDIFSKVYSPAFHRRFERAFQRLEGEGAAEDMRRFAILSDATMHFDIFDRLNGIKCPVMLSGVVDDTVMGGCGTPEIAEALHIGASIYPGSGHAAYDEYPGFPAELAAFFRS